MKGIKIYSDSEESEDEGASSVDYIDLDHKSAKKTQVARKKNRKAPMKGLKIYSDSEESEDEAANAVKKKENE